MKKILIGSPIHQKPEILKHFLNSLQNLNRNQETVFHYLFIDDNEDEKSVSILNDFSNFVDNVTIYKQDIKEEYICDVNTHYWNEKLIWKVAEFKNMIIQVANENEYDYLFLVDSDILLHPDTILQLVKDNKDIISNIFWTKWQPDFPELPQVWLFDQYEQYSKHRSEQLSQNEKIERHHKFVSMLREPGVYEVGGLGACTLISKKAIKAGINFSEIKNVSFWGEDRHFCIRAQALGFDLFVDTHHPSYHIYRDSDVEGIQDYIDSCLLGIKKKEYEKVLNVLTNAFTSMGTFNFIYGYKEDWSKYFHGELKNILIQEAESRQQSSSENHLVVKASIANITLESEDNGSYLFKFDIVNDGIENGKSFYEKVNCIATLKIIQGNWLITHFEVL